MYKLIFVLILFIIFTICIAKTIKYDDFDKDRLISLKVEGNVKENKTIKIPLGSTFDDISDEIDIKEDADLSTISDERILSNEEIITIDKKSDIRKISINNANYSELMSLPGIGTSIANRIIEYREKYGNFTKLEEIMNVKGIGENKYEKIKKYICL